MWPFKKNKTNQSDSNHYNLRWYDVGDGNPMDARILDIRDFTQTMKSTTKDPAIAEAFVQNRNDDGLRFRDQALDFATFSSTISYPHNGEKLDGIVFKSPQMEVKWDIYAFEEFFYFVRSWTGELAYRVKYENAGSELRLTQIDTNAVSRNDTEQTAEQNVHSIMMTHVFNRVWPYYIPIHMQNSKPIDIAMFLFAQFGRKATIATEKNVLKINMKRDG